MASRTGPFADKLGSDPTHVVSTTLNDPSSQNTSVICDNVAERVVKLEEQTAAVILVAGSCTLVGTLVGADLVDESGEWCWSGSAV